LLPVVTWRLQQADAPCHVPLPPPPHVLLLARLRRILAALKPTLVAIRAPHLLLLLP
jgi:hypothetical protein